MSLDRSRVHQRRCFGSSDHLQNFTFRHVPRDLLLEGSKSSAFRNPYSNPPDGILGVVSRDRVSNLEDRKSSPWKWLDTDDSRSGPTKTPTIFSGSSHAWSCASMSNWVVSHPQKKSPNPNQPFGPSWLNSGLFNLKTSFPRFRRCQGQLGGP